MIDSGVDQRASIRLTPREVRFQESSSGRPRLKICHLLEGPTLPEGEMLATRLAHHFKSLISNSFVFLGDPGPLGEKLRDQGFTVAVLGRTSGRDADQARRVRGLLLSEKADLIHAHQSRAFFHGLMARLFYRRPPILFTEHMRPYPDHPPVKRVVASRMLLESRDRIVAASDSIRRALILNEGFPSGQVEVIYNGVVPAPEFDFPPDGQSVRKEIGVERGDLLVLQVAPFEAAQDHALAIRTLAQVVRNLPRVRLALSGEGPELGPIREMVHRCKLEPHVLFLGGRADNTRLLTAADLVLLTNLTDGIPPILIQSLAAGRPVVATRVGGVGEIVEDRVCGLLACHGDYSTLADHICRLNDDLALRERLGRQGRERAEALFTEARTQRAYSRLYSSMLSH